jgi:hypothetical protein
MARHTRGYHVLAKAVDRLAAQERKHAELHQKLHGNTAPKIVESTMQVEKTTNEGWGAYGQKREQEASQKAWSALHSKYPQHKTKLTDLQQKNWTAKAAEEHMTKNLKEENKDKDDTKVPFKPDKEGKKAHRKDGPMSRVRHLARMALKKQLKEATDKTKKDDPYEKALKAFLKKNKPVVGKYHGPRKDERLNKVTAREDFENHLDDLLIESAQWDRTVSTLKNGEFKKFEHDVVVAGKHYKVPVFVGKSKGGCVKQFRDEMTCKKHSSSDSMDESFRVAPKKFQKAAARASWMKDFEDHVTKHAPEHTGKIDWDTATYLHNSGHEAKAAAEKYVSNRKTVKEDVSIRKAKRNVNQLISKAKKSPQSGFKGYGKTMDDKKKAITRKDLTQEETISELSAQVVKSYAGAAEKDFRANPTKKRAVGIKRAFSSLRKQQTESFSPTGKGDLGEFKHAETKKYFNYGAADDPWAKKHNLPHKIHVADGKVRYGHVKGTVAHVAVDENDDGTPKMEKWPLAKHSKYTKESYVGFDKLTKKVHSPALAAYIGRKKYGKKKFDKAAATGKKMDEARGHLISIWTKGKDRYYVWQNSIAGYDYTLENISTGQETLMKMSYHRLEARLKGLGFVAQNAGLAAGTVHEDTSVATAAIVKQLHTQRIDELVKSGAYPADPDVDTQDKRKPADKKGATKGKKEPVTIEPTMDSITTSGQPGQ